MSEMCRLLTSTQWAAVTMTTGLQLSRAAPQPRHLLSDLGTRWCVLYSGTVLSTHCSAEMGASAFFALSCWKQGAEMKVTIAQNHKHIAELRRARRRNSAIPKDKKRCGHNLKIQNNYLVDQSFVWVNNGIVVNLFSKNCYFCCLILKKTWNLNLSMTFFIIK